MMLLNWHMFALTGIKKNHFYKDFYIKKWKRCRVCKSFIFVKKVIINLNVCYKCNFHFIVSSRNRVKMFFDKDSFFEVSNNFLPCDCLNFIDTKHYYSRLVDTQIVTGEIEAFLGFKGKVFSIDVLVGVFDFNFIGGSMGKIVGDKFIYLVNLALKYRVSLVCFVSSGGARMQESVISLMQMSRVASVLNRLAESNVLYISVMINPCMGGVSASLAMLGDINVAEINALIGFTGPRVIKETVKTELPFGFQKSEFLLRKGFLDFIVDRSFLRYRLGNVLKILMKC